MRLSARDRLYMRSCMFIVLLLIVLLVTCRIYLTKAPVIMTVVETMMVLEVAGAFVLLADLFNRRHFVLGRHKAVVSDEVYGGEIKNV